MVRNFRTKKLQCSEILQKTIEEAKTWEYFWITPRKQKNIFLLSKTMSAVKPWSQVTRVSRLICALLTEFQSVTCSARLAGARRDPKGGESGHSYWDPTPRSPSQPARWPCLLSRHHEMEAHVWLPASALLHPFDRKPCREESRPYCLPLWLLPTARLSSAVVITEHTHTHVLSLSVRHWACWDNSVSIFQELTL